jgi:hypothetical protein
LSAVAEIDAADTWHAPASPRIAADRGLEDLTLPFGVKEE